jgi:hypothetical protein
MGSSKARGFLLAALVLLALAAAFLLAMRVRIGPLYENILIDPSGLLQQRPWMSLSGSELRQGLFPLWNPFQGFGQPHLANIQTASFYPLNLIVYAGGAKSGFELWLLMRLWLGGFFLYIFLRQIKLDMVPSLAGSLIWPLGGYGLWFMQLADLNTQILLPVFLILFRLLAKSARLRYFLLIVLIGWLSILGGHPEAIFNSWLIALAYFGFRMSQERLAADATARRIGLAGIAGFLSILLAALVLLPFINYFTRSWSLHYPGFGFFHLDVKTIWSLLFPARTFSSRGPGRIAVNLLGRGCLEVFKAGYWKTTVPGVMPGPGIVAAAMALLGLVRLGRARADFAFFGLLLIFLLGFTYGLAPFKWLALVPPFSSASNFKFYYSEIYLCISILAALGFGRIDTRVKRWITAALSAVMLINLFLYCLCINPYLDLHLSNLDRQSWLRFLEKKSSEGVPVRVSSIDSINPVMAPGVAALFGVNDVASSDALFPESYFRLMDNLNGISAEQRLNYFYPEYYVRVLRRSLESPLFGKYGIRWVLSNFFSDADMEELARHDFAQRAFSAEGFKRARLVFQNVLLEKYTAWPRAFLVGSISLPLQTAEIKQSSTAEIISYAPQNILIRTASDEPGYLVLTDLYYPGWLALIDGRESRIEEAFGGFRAVSLPAGKHKIEYRFEPADFRIGLELSLASLIMVCIMFAAGRMVVKKS